jgi:FHA domain/DUF1707 SHOCT-like domain
MRGGLYRFGHLMQRAAQVTTELAFCLRRDRAGPMEPAAHAVYETAELVKSTPRDAQQTGGAVAASRGLERGRRRTYRELVVSPDSGPQVLRASDDDREQVIEALRLGSVEGRLSYQTFLHRLDAALRTRRVAELHGLLSDLPPAPGRAGWLTRPARWCSSLRLRARRAWWAPRLPVLTLPRGDRAFVIGRSPLSDLAVPDMTVSWRHAELRWADGDWILTDLGSTNGTRVNGWRAGGGFAVRPGDQVSFGAVSFRVAG